MSLQRPLAILIGGAVIFATAAFSTAAADKATYDTSSAPQGRLTVTDMLRLKAFGGVTLSPDGKTLVFENHRALGSVHQSMFWPLWRYDSQVFLASTDTGRVLQIRAAGSIASILYGSKDPRIPSSWSEKSDALIVGLAMGSGEYRTGVVNPATGRVTLLPGPTPFATVEFDWLGDGRLVYVTSRGRTGSPTTEDMANKAAKRWRASWQGVEPQVTVSSANPRVAASPIPPPGALMLANTATGRAMRLAGGDFLAPTVSPDGKHLAVICMDPSMRSRAVSGISLGLNMVAGELCVYRIEGDRAYLEMRTRGFVVLPRRLTWSPDSQALLVSARRETADLYDVGLWQYETSTRALQLIPSPTGTAYRDTSLSTSGVDVLPYGWIGGKPAIVSAMPSSGGAAPPEAGRLEYGERKGRRYDVWTISGDSTTNLTQSFKSSTVDFLPGGDGGALVAADGRLWKLTLSAPPKALTSYTDPRVSGLRGWVASKSNEQSLVRLRVTEEEPDRDREAIFDLDSAVFLPADAAAPDAITVATAARSTRRAVLVNSDHDATTLLVADGSRLTPIASNNQFLDNLALGTSETFQFSVGADTRLGYLLKPPGYVSTRRYPAIMLVYGGSVFGHSRPVWARADTRIAFENGRFWAAQGYVVICPSLPIGAGADSDQMRSITEGALAALDELIGRGIVDGDRVAVMGTSFGGYSTFALLENAPSRFKTGIAESSGPLDPIHFWGSASPWDGIADQSHGDPTEEFDSESWIEGGQMQLKAPFWQNPQAYLRNGPLYHPDKVRVPVMLIHGDLDGFDSFNDAQRMFAALVRTGTEPVFLHYWGEVHGIAYPANQIDEITRISSWLSSYIGAASVHTQ